MWTMQSDIWSLGCILYEMITLQHPFLGRNLRELYGKVSCSCWACPACLRVSCETNVHVHPDSNESKSSSSV